MKIYLSGKITGDPTYKSKFKRAEARIQVRYPEARILNPADFPIGLSEADYMRLSFALIDAADKVIFLPDFTDSEGAMLEYAYCQYVGKLGYAMKEEKA